MTNWTHRAMMVPPSYVELARALAAGLDPVAGSGMFPTALYDAQGQIAYYVSNGLIGEEFAALLDDPQALFAACEAVGAPVTLEQCQALLSSSIVSTRNALELMEEMGLRFGSGE